MAPSFAPDTPLYAFSPSELDALFAQAALRRCAPGEVIIEEGEFGDTMFFLVEGEAEARVAGGRRVRQYKPGTFFGELAIINPGHRRSGTVVAKTAVAVQVLSQLSLERLTDAHPRTVFKLIQRTCAFLVDAERSLIDDLQHQNDQLQQTLARLDVTQRRLSEEEESARRDPLTGLFNRRAFDSEVQPFLEGARSMGRGLALLALDLDRFKQLNDTLGHGAGDSVLREIGSLLRSKVRASDYPCRAGGDEFLVLLIDTDERAAKARAEALRTAVDAMPQTGIEEHLRITSTVGGTMAKLSETPEVFVQRADEALYAAKRAGRNRVGWVSL